MAKVRTWIMQEVREVIPPAIFFLIAFHVLALSRALMLREYGIHVAAAAGATVGALIVAKVVLIADSLPLINRFPERPLIYNVGWKTTMYVIAALAVHYLEHLVPVWWRMGNLGDANQHLLDEVVWPHFWAIQLWLVVLLFVYCAMRELVRTIGPHEVRRMFFGPGPVAPARADASRDRNRAPSPARQAPRPARHAPRKGGSTHG